MDKNFASSIVKEFIIKSLENNISPWHQPWVNGGAMSINGNYYRGINAIILGWQKYSDNRWLTFAKVKKLGGFVKKGEKSLPAVFWQFIKKQEKQDDGTTVTKTIPLCKVYYVFNVEQCENLTLPKSKVFHLENTPIELAERIWADFKDKPELHHNKQQAYYSPADDVISIPEITQFHSSEEYYATLFHEAVHSTGAKHRLDRLNAESFGSEKYGKEELIAEIGSQILCQSIGITKTLDNSIAYCQAWCRAIKAMPVNAVLQAASTAQKAVDYIRGVKFESEENME